MTKLIPILSGRCLVVELLETKWPYRNLNFKIRAELGKPLAGKMLVRGSNSAWQEVDLPTSNWRIIGMLSEVTEEQARQIARHRKHNTIRDGKLAERLMFYNHTTNIYGHATAIQSLESAVLAEGWYFDPIGDEPIRLPEGHNSHGTHESMWNQWREAQSRVLDRSRCLLLGRV